MTLTAFVFLKLPIHMSCRKSLLLTGKMLGQPVNTMAAGEKYLVFNRDNLTIPIEMQLSEKRKKNF